MRGRYVIAAAAAATVVWGTVAYAIASPGGNKNADVAVPRLLGLRGDAAATKLEAIGLRFFADEHLRSDQPTSMGWSMTTTQSLAGVVVAQSPAAGSRVHLGSTVELSVAHRSQPPAPHPGA